MKCENCNQEHDGQYASRRFCSSKCARGFSTKNKRQDINKKVSEKLSKPKIEKTCLCCEKVFLVLSYRNRTFCSHSCASKYHVNTNNNFFSIEHQRNAGIKSAQSQQRRSKNEIYFSELCKEKFKNIKCNEPIFNGWDADIIVEDYKIAILWNGTWHYEKITKKHSLLQVQNRDKIKLTEIEKCGYISYIIQDMGRYDENFVENEFNKLLILLKTDR